MKLFNIQHKLLSVRHRITKKDYVNMNLPKDQFEAMVKMELTKQVTDHVMKNLKIETTAHDDYTELKGKAYFMSERDMLNVILEVTELEKEELEKLNMSIKKELGIRG